MYHFFLQLAKSHSAVLVCLPRSTRPDLARSLAPKSFAKHIHLAGEQKSAKTAFKKQITLSLGRLVPFGLVPLLARRQLDSLFNTLNISTSRQHSLTLPLLHHHHPESRSSCRYFVKIHVCGENYSTAAIQLEPSQNTYLICLVGVGRLRRRQGSRCR